MSIDLLALSPSSNSHHKSLSEDLQHYWIIKRGGPRFDSNALTLALTCILLSSSPSFLYQPVLCLPYACPHPYFISISSFALSVVKSKMRASELSVSVKFIELSRNDEWSSRGNDHERDGPKGCARMKSHAVITLIDVVCYYLHSTSTHCTPTTLRHSSQLFPQPTNLPPCYSCSNSYHEVRYSSFIAGLAPLWHRHRIHSLAITQNSQLSSTGTATCPPSWTTLHGPRCCRPCCNQGQNWRQEGKSKRLLWQKDHHGREAGWFRRSRSQSSTRRSDQSRKEQFRSYG